MTAAKHLHPALRTASRRIGSAGTRPGPALSQRGMTGRLARVVSDIMSSRAKLKEILSFAEPP